MNACPLSICEIIKKNLQKLLLSNQHIKNGHSKTKLCARYLALTYQNETCWNYVVLCTHIVLFTLLPWIHC